MKYEQTPIVKPLIKRKWAAKQTNDITKLSTFRILMHLYRRHERELLILAVWLQFAILIWMELGRA